MLLGDSIPHKITTYKIWVNTPPKILVRVFNEASSVHID